MKAGFDGGFHLISQLKLTASPQGEAFGTRYPSAFPLRGRCRPARRVTDEGDAPPANCITKTSLHHHDAGSLHFFFNYSCTITV